MRLGAQPLPRVLELAASKAADFPAFGHGRYPTEAEKLDICIQTSLSLTQVNNWRVTAARTTHCGQIDLQSAQHLIATARQTDRQTEKRTA